MFELLTESKWFVPGLVVVIGLVGSFVWAWLTGFRVAPSRPLDNSHQIASDLAHLRFRADIDYLNRNHNPGNKL